MRISDWSSDVCSSDLAGPSMASRVDAAPTVHPVAAHTEATIEAGAYRADAVAAAQQMVQVAGTAVPRPRGLEELVRAYASAETSDAEQECLAGAVYFEAQGEPLRSEEHTSEIQSLMRLSYAVFCLQKKKQKN